MQLVACNLLWIYGQIFYSVAQGFSTQHPEAV